MKEANDEYMTVPAEKRIKRNQEGEIIYKTKINKNGQTEFVLDAHGQKIPEKEPVPGKPTQYKLDIMQLRVYDAELEKQKDVMQGLQAEEELRKNMKKRIQQTENNIKTQVTENNIKSEINKEFENENKNLSKELKEKLKQQAKNDLEMENQEEKYKELKRAQDIKNKNEFLKMREEQMLSPEYLQQRREIENMKIQNDMEEEKRKMKENENKIKEARMKQERELRTLDAISEYDKQFDSQTLGQFITQLNQGNEDSNEKVLKAKAVHDNKIIHETFKTKYDDDGERIYKRILDAACLQDPHMNLSLREINGTNALLEYTLNNLHYDLDEDKQKGLNDFIGSEGFNNFISNWIQEHPE